MCQGWKTCDAGRVSTVIMGSLMWRNNDERRLLKGYGSLLGSFLFLDGDARRTVKRRGGNKNLRRDDNGKRLL